jgi:hypothetical protein
MSLFLRRYSRALVLVGAAVASACGGGGDDGAATAASASYDLNAVQTTVISSPQSFSASASSGGNTYQMFLSIAPGSDGFFEGAVRRRATQTLTIRENGATVAATTFTGYYATNPFQIIGAEYAGGGYLVATTTHAALPSSAPIGASGSLGTQTLYSDSTKSNVLARQQSTWTLDSGAGGMANFCVNTVLSNPSNVIIGTTAGCYRLGANGSINGIRWTISVEGQTLTFQ